VERPAIFSRGNFRVCLLGLREARSSSVSVTAKLQCRVRTFSTAPGTSPSVRATKLFFVRTNSASSRTLANAKSSKFFGAPEATALGTLDMRIGFAFCLELHAKGYEKIYKLAHTNSVEPALILIPCPWHEVRDRTQPMRISKVPSAVASGAPKNLEDLAFASVRELAEFRSKRKKFRRSALTEMYLGRLKKYDPTLKFAVTLTEERAPRAGQAGRRGNCRGKISRAAPRLAVGRQGFAGDEGRSNDVGWQVDSKAR